MGMDFFTLLLSGIIVHAILFQKNELLLIGPAYFLKEFLICCL